MKKIFFTAAGIGIAAFMFPSCIVSKKKFDAETARANKEHDDAAALTKRVAEQNVTINSQKKEIQGLMGNLTDASLRVAGLRDSVSTLEKKLRRIGNEHQSTSEELNNTKAEIAAQKKKLEQLQSFIDQQQKATEALRKKVADALQGFNSNELTITRKNGKVYVSMQEGLLFPSGSAVVNPKGKLALSKVAGVLNTSADVNINIEGHTDSLPIHTKQYEDNWSLSTARATSIAHVLIDEYKVEPGRLIASGRSQYDPLASNSTQEGRAANRRTEIILEPKLDELVKLMSGDDKN